jgi:predicted O-methyltransferase YrrM
MVRRFAPRRIVEVGSGHSTRFLARAAADGATGTKLTAIDPAPRATLAGLPIEQLRVRVQDAGDAPFARLESGDFLFVDSSHKMEPGSDVQLLLEHVLPTLPAGVLVHFHDIFLPGDYPKAWAWRRYSEQEAVAKLLPGSGYSVLFASAWILAQRQRVVETGVLGRLPLVPGAIESSLWLLKMRA